MLNEYDRTKISIGSHYVIILINTCFMILGISGLVLSLQNSNNDLCGPHNYNWLKNNYSMNLISSILIFLVYFVPFIMRPSTKAHIKFLEGNKNIMIIKIILNQIYTSAWTFYAYDTRKYCYDFNLIENSYIQSLYEVHFVVVIIFVTVVSCIAVIVFIYFIVKCLHNNNSNPNPPVIIPRYVKRAPEEKHFAGSLNVNNVKMMTNSDEESVELISNNPQEQFRNAPREESPKILQYGKNTLIV